MAKKPVFKYYDEDLTNILPEMGYIDGFAIKQCV